MLGARRVSCEDGRGFVGGGEVGTPKVTCSRLRISLQEPKSRAGLLLRLPTRASHAASAATFSICVRYNGKENSSELPLTPTMAGQLALEAFARDQTIGDLAKDLLQEVTMKSLIEDVLKD
jgi:hypothetical protein